MSNIREILTCGHTTSCALAMCLVISQRKLSSMLELCGFDNEFGYAELV